MKSFFLSYKFLLVLISSLPLALCSKDDNNQKEIDEVFEPIEITFSEEFFTDCNQTVTTNDISLTFRPVSENEPGANTIGSCDFREYSLGIENRENHPFKGFYSLFLGSFLEIDLSNLSGYSKISLTVEDNCAIGCTGANLYVGNEIVDKKLNTTSNPVQEELIFDLENINAQKVTVYSYEGILYKINIE